MFCCQHHFGINNATMPPCTCTKRRACQGGMPPCARMKIRACQDGMPPCTRMKIRACQRRDSSVHPHENQGVPGRGMREAHRRGEAEASKTYSQIYPLGHSTSHLLTKTIACAESSKTPPQLAAKNPGRFFALALLLGLPGRDSCTPCPSSVSLVWTVATDGVAVARDDDDDDDDASRTSGAR